MNYTHPIRNLDDIQKLKLKLMEYNYMYYFLFVLGINSNLRISDLLRLRVKDVRNVSHIEIKEKKTGKQKMFKISPELELEINKYTHAMNADSYLFPSPHKGKKGSITRDTAFKVLNKAAKAIGMTQSVSPHSLRKSFAFHLYLKTKDVVLVMKLLNHSSPSVTLRYIGIEQEQLDDVTVNFSL